MKVPDGPPPSLPALSTDRPVPKRSVAEFVERYRPYGFFAGQSTGGAAARARRSYAETVGEKLPARTRYDELALLAGDGREAFFDDVEADVIEGNDAYVTALEEWGRASRGTFRPKGITERWVTPEGPVRIRYTESGRQRTATARGLDDFLDVCVLTRDVNRVIAPRGRRFELYRPDATLGQQIFAVALTSRQKRDLEGTGWRFARPGDADAAYEAGSGERAGRPAC